MTAHQLSLLDAPSAPGATTRLGAPEGLRYAADVIDETAENDLLSAIDRQPWMTSMARRVQHYGWRYDYKSRRLARDAYLGPLPSFLAPLLAAVRDATGLVPDQAIVNEYEPGQGIAGHVDCEPCFGPVIAMVGLGSDVEMDFTQRVGGGRWALPFARRGLVVLEGPARYDWTHAIAKRRRDAAFGIERGRRVSVTFRAVIS